MILTQEYSRVASRLDRAWMVSPEGKLHVCGQDHTECWERHPELFEGRRRDEFVKTGWGEIGYFDYAGSIYLHVRELTDTLFRVYSDVIYSLKLEPQFRVEIITGRESMDFPYNEFRKFESAQDVHQHRKRRRAALPDSRNMLRHYSMKELSEPLRKAFELMGLDRDSRYRKMSLPQIVSELRKREEMLEEETGWTADDLIRDLNLLLE